MSNFGWPYRPDSRGRTAGADTDIHIRELIEQLLFTAPGERVNRPDLGTNVRSLVFAPNSSELATATQFMVQGALQNWLGTLIQVESVSVAAEDNMLTIQVQYVVRRDLERHSSTFTFEA